MKLLNISGGLAVRTRGWFHFNVTIPRNSTLNVRVMVTGPDKSGRSILTVHGLQLISAGSNIPCPNSKFDVSVTRTVKTTQFNRASAILGYFSNLGKYKLNNFLFC